MLRGQMMSRQLMVSSFLEHASECHADAEIVSRSVEGPIHRYTYRDAHGRACRLANALRRLGLRSGDRVATLAWNTYRHFELYFGIAGMGAVCHTVNPRLFDEQIVYIVNHAADRFMFLDVTFVPLVERLAARLPSVEGYVILTDRTRMPETKLPNPLCYEDVLGAEADSFEWPNFDENTAAALCYTSGTTGNPKGALYSHRSTVLHALTVGLADNIAINSSDTVLPIVPMFHVNAWAMPFNCALAGTKLVLPGARFDGEAVYELLEGEEVTCTAGVPTIWLGLLDHMRRNNLRFSRHMRVLIGGAAAPIAMIRAFEEDYGCTVFHAWGMTEMSPVGTTGRLKPKHRRLPSEERYRAKLKQGQKLWGVDMKIVGPEGETLPHDGKAFGELLVRGPWVIDSYYNDPAANRAAFDGEGWFRTGDVATIDEDGIVQLVDRAKDVIKSGGEWISSIDLESVASSHPDLAQVAVIGLPHVKWGERPLLCAVAKAGAYPSKEQVIEHLCGKIANWWVPDDVEFVEALPLTATGKVSKLQLRERFKDHVWPPQRPGRVA